MKLFTCKPLTFVQSLTKAPRKALANILRVSSKGDVTATILRKALEYDAKA